MRDPEDATKRERAVDPELFRRLILEWFDLAKRPLPWRGRGDPYDIWVSEVMLQQTRAEVASRRYPEFLERFPNIDLLAADDEATVVAAWAGLGYYRRAKNLLAASRILVRENGGRFPDDPDRARALPGVGRYIAHAVLSIAYGKPLAVVDGNVKRVLSRVMMLTGGEEETQIEADRLLDPARPGDANQAVMELGATLCVPRSPRCGSCPLARVCAAFASDQVASFPRRPQKSAPRRIDTSLWIVVNADGRIWLEHREMKPLAGLWMLPWRESSDREPGRPLGAITHAIMTHRYRCRVLHIGGEPDALPGNPAGKGGWFEREEVGRLPQSSLLRKALALLEKRDDPTMDDERRRS